MKPIVISTAEPESKLFAEPLSGIWWQGRQWAVTEYGLECRDGAYPIAVSKSKQNLMTGCETPRIDCYLYVRKPSWTKRTLLRYSLNVH